MTGLSWLLFAVGLALILRSVWPTRGDAIKGERRSMKQCALDYEARQARRHGDDGSEGNHQWQD